ncbi:MAG: DUF2284 domain-containing protein [Eubacteriales bacterium]
MSEKDPLFEPMIAKALCKGACRAAVIRVSDVRLDPIFRRMCQDNVCGNYGKCWMCPPDAGEIGQLMEEFRRYDFALVYQSVSQLEDSYDFEGMMTAAESHSRLTREIRKAFPEDAFGKVLHLGAGGCHVCPICAKRENLPCRHPDLAISSLETYGVDVSALAASCGMRYTHGQNTVTYFGAMLFSGWKKPR